MLSENRGRPQYFLLGMVLQIRGDHPEEGCLGKFRVGKDWWESSHGNFFNFLATLDGHTGAKTTGVGYGRL